MQVPDLHPEVVIVLGQVLRHALGERRDQHPAAARNRSPDLPEQVIHLPTRRMDLDHGVHQAGRPDDLLHNRGACMLKLVASRSGRHVDDLIDAPLELREAQRSVVIGGGQAEAVLHQTLLAGPVALVHPLDLRNRRMGFVNNEEILLREIIEERRRWFARGPSAEVAGIVLDAVTVPHRPDHLKVEPRALFNALRLQQLLVLLEKGDALVQLGFDAVEGALVAVRRDEVVGVRVDRHFRQPGQCLPRERIDLMDRIHRVAEQFDPYGDGVG